MLPKGDERLDSLRDSTPGIIYTYLGRHYDNTKWRRDLTCAVLMVCTMIQGPSTRTSTQALVGSQCQWSSTFMGRWFERGLQD